MTTVIRVPALMPLIGNLGGLIPPLTNTKFEPWFRGEAFEGKTIIDILWPNAWPSDSNAANGMNQLDEALNDIDDDIEVYLHSAGSQIGSKWRRQKGPTSSVPVDKVLFVETGNPERMYGGACIVDPVGYRPVYPGTKPHYWLFCPTPSQFHGGVGVGYGEPPVSKYRVKSYTREGDGWSNYPSRPNPSALALKCAKAGMGSTHLDYSDVKLGSPDHLYYQEEQITYILVPDAELPGIDQAQRTEVEASWQLPPYRRGGEDPDPELPDLTGRAVWRDICPGSKRPPADRIRKTGYKLYVATCSSCGRTVPVSWWRIREHRI